MTIYLMAGSVTRALSVLRGFYVLRIALSSLACVCSGGGRVKWCCFASPMHERDKLTTCPGSPEHRQAPNHPPARTPDEVGSAASQRTLASAPFCLPPRATKRGPSWLRTGPTRDTAARARTHRQST